MMGVKKRMAKHLPGRGPTRSSVRSAIALVFLAFVVGCSSDSSTRPGDVAPLDLQLVFGDDDDPRTYSVGRVQIRGSFADGSEIPAQIFEIDRETGRFDLDVSMRAGSGYTLLVEPLGSALLPNGGKTLSGVALQAVVRNLDIVAEQVTTVTAELRPFIPDDLSLVVVSDVLELHWRPMAIAETHRVKLIQINSANGELSDRFVDLPEDARGSVPVHPLLGELPVIGFQLQSKNEFAESAFSDTLFVGGAAAH